MNSFKKRNSLSDCNCDIHGTVPDICDKDTGRCLCKDGYTGTLCANCIAGFYNTFSSPDCLPCNCSIIGSSSTACDALGKCSCLPNFAGRQCTQCSPGYFNYPECLRKLNSSQIFNILLIKEILFNLFF